ncbi:hypothetical protein [Thiocapsa bogorovii]|uniref:hypothetical protein n=1 Tax=Thiocapsa bogorovii TaxID=521689 RepID=UPI001E411A7F|nr:hypothetical protein [Thiocapsa bogorovii]UHD17872.1 hypothetical protein LT988_07440 [Thiocapsa bogorovii]
MSMAQMVTAPSFSDCPLLDEAQALFLLGPVSISAASHDAAGVPSLARAFGCRVAEDRREVVVFVPTRSGDALLRDLAAGAPIAVVFSRPKTHETLQLKAHAARLEPLGPTDRQRMRASGSAFAAELIALGYSAAFAHALVAPSKEDGVSVVFSPTLLFDQTPGPRAGRRLEPQP